MNAAGESDDDGDLILGDPTGASGFPEGNYNDLIPDNNQVDPFEVQEDAKFVLPLNWKQWFLSLEDHEFLVEVEKDFIKDKFNLIGLKSFMPSKERYKECLRLILSHKVPNEEDL